MYRNKSHMYKICKDMLSLMNSDLYLYSLAYATYDIIKDENCFDASIESKAAYMKTDKVTIEENNNEIKRLFEKELDNDVRVQGMFREEITNAICYYREMGVDLLSLWHMHKPDDTEEIAAKAFKKFDTIKNSETYPFDTLAAQLVVGECVRGYFDRVLEENL